MQNFKRDEILHFFLNFVSFCRFYCLTKSKMVYISPRIISSFIPKVGEQFTRGVAVQKGFETIASEMGSVSMTRYQAALNFWIVWRDNSNFDWIMGLIWGWQL